jgi:hypothetical protein
MVQRILIRTWQRIIIHFVLLKTWYRGITYHFVLLRTWYTESFSFSVIKKMVQGITDHFAINDCNATYKAFTGDSATQ